MKIGQVRQNIIVLAFSNLIIGLIEFVFNMYLSRVFGAEGLGLLSIITPINCIFLSFMTEGVVITMSKTSSRLYSLGENKAMAVTITIATISSFLWSLFLVGVILITAPFIAKYFLGDSMLVYPILATCPLMLLMSVSNILKGYFLGLSKIRVPALINISEKLLRFPILYFLISNLLNNSRFPPVTMIFLCYAIGEMQSVLLLLIYYRFQRGETVELAEVRKSFKRVLGPLVRGSVPICLNQCLLELVNALSQIIVKSRLCSIGLSKGDALSLLGKYRGMVFPLMSYPMILVGAACAIVVPKISTMVFAGKRKNAKRLIRRSLIFSFVIGIATALLTFIFADDMGIIFYNRDDLAMMIRVGGLSSPVIYISATTTSLLISLGMESLSFRNSLIQQLLLLGLLYVFTGISTLNIYGYFMAIVLSNLLLIILNLYYLKTAYCNPIKPIV